MKRTLVWLGVVVSIAAAGFLACRQTRTGGPRPVVIGTALHALLDAPLPAWMPGDSAARAGTWAALRDVYERRRRRPAWFEGLTPSGDAFALATALGRAGADGLDAAAYGLPAIRAGLDSARAIPFGTADSLLPGLAELDLRLSAAFLQYAHDLRGGRFPAAVLDPDWVPLRDTIDAVGALERALATHRVADVLGDMAPAGPEYVRLRDALAAYRRVAEQGGWPAIPAGPPLERGDDDPRCTVLRARLLTSADLADSSGGTVFDASLERGVKHFQSRHGLPSSGRFDKETLSALAVPVAGRIRTLEMNLERARWVTAPLQEPCIRVNIPEFRLRLLNGGADSLVMKVVVGQPSNPTPIFSDVMTYLEFNPVWRVPKRIVVDELLPGYRRDRQYFVKHHMRVLWTAQRGLPEIDPASVDWQSISADTFHFLVQQDPGPENPLGQIKFMLPNEYDVYLHDTSARGYFRRDARALSHGCVRVQNPLALAEYALRGRPEASRDSIVAIVESQRSRRVPMARTIPVHLQYWTAWVDTAGAVNFRPDLYRLDTRMAEAIRAGSEAHFELNPTADWTLKAGGVAGRIAYAPDSLWVPAPRTPADSAARDTVRR